MSCEIRSMMTSYFFGSSIRIPPIFTNSAVTPSAFMELIFSTNAGGNVFSIPKRIPIFVFAITVSSIMLVERRSPSPAPWQRGGRARTPVAKLKILPRHPLPQRPIMLAVVAVDIQPMRNPLAFENRRHLHVRVQAHIPVRRSQHNLHLPVPAQEPLIAHVRQIVRRIVEVAIVVVVAVEKALDVERPAHGHTRGNHIRM